MEELRRNLLVGLFVLVGLGALGALVVLFGRDTTFLAQRNAYAVHIRFDWVSGIRPGTPVTVKGIEVGRVLSVGLMDPKHIGSGVDVVVSIRRDYEIPVGSSAQTTEPVFGTGRPPVEIIPSSTATAGNLTEGAMIEGKVVSMINTLFPPGVIQTFEGSARQIGEAAEALTPVLEELQDMFAKRTPQQVDLPGGPQGNLSSAVARLDASLRHFNQVLGDEQVKSQLRETIANAQEISEKGKAAVADLQSAAAESREMMADARKLVTKVDQSLDSFDTRINDVARIATSGLDKADRFMGYLDTIGQQITSGQGTLGNLVMDGKLYEAMRVSAERLSLAIEEFRALIAEWRKGKIRVAL